MRPRRLLAVFIALAGLLAGAATASASPSGVVISQLRTRTAASQYDEYVQITNTTAKTVDLSGWTLYDCYQSGGAQKVGADSAALPKGTTLPAGKTFVFGKDGGDYTGTSDATYQYQVTETGGFQLRDASGTVQDGVGAPGTACAEGHGLSFPTSGSDFTFTRKADTGDNAADFGAPSGQANGTACGSACAAPPAPTAIDTIQGDGASSPLVGQTVQVTGVVIGVDNQEDVSNYVDLEPDTAGIYVETPVVDQDRNLDTSEGIYVSDVAAAQRTAAHIGQTVTVSGVVKEQYGLTTLDAAGEKPTFTGRAKRSNLPPPAVIDEASARAQGSSRAYYESLEDMRVRLPVGTANSGGTDKFGELYLDPGTKTGLNMTGYNGLKPPVDLLNVTQDAGSDDIDPTNPSAEPDSTTRVNANLHDHVRNVVGPLGYDFGDYEIVPQPGQAPTVTHDGVTYPPRVPQPAAQTIRIANFNMENLFGAGMTDDGHTFTQAEVDRKTTQLANAIKLMREPDIIADEEVASHAAYDEVARKLGDYRDYWIASNDRRHIAVGFLVKKGIDVTGVQQLGKTATTTVKDCNDNPADDPQLFERPPLALSVNVNGLKFTLIGNHLASLGHPEACREAQADYLNGQVKSIEAAGGHAMVIGDLNDYHDAPALATNLIAGTSLENLWSRAPVNNRYSFQFDGQVEALDHIFVDDFLSPRVREIRYVHFDNDYFPRANPSSPIGVSDHDPPVAVLKVPAPR